MPLRATPGEVAPVLDHVAAFGQPAAAARAGHVAHQRGLRVVAVFVQLAEQVDHAAGCHAQVLVAVEPEAVAGVAQVQFQGGAVVPGHVVHLHRGAAGRAGGGAGGKTLGHGAQMLARRQGMS